MTRRRKQQGQAKLDGARGTAQWKAIYQAYNAIFNLAELTLLPQRLSLPQIYLLGVLKSAGGMLTTGEISRAMVRQARTEIVDRLEERALVERVFDRSDRRKVWVRLTEKGERKLEEAFSVASRLAEEVSSALSDQELHDLQAKMEKLRGVAMDRLAAALTSDGGRLYGPGV